MLLDHGQGLSQVRLNLRKLSQGENTTFETFRTLGQAQTNQETSESMRGTGKGP